MEDLIKLLDENPQWVEALRVRLLTRELIELPEKFAQFAASTEQRLGRLEADVTVLKSDVGVLKSDVGVLKSDVGVLKNDVGVLKSDVRNIRDGLGPLRGAHARNMARERADSIAERCGLEFIRVLDRREIRKFSRGQDLSHIEPGDLESFHEADIVIEATSQRGGVCYVAVEVSYTVNGRDTQRASRNANYLTRFTGRQSYAAVAGLRYDDRVRPIIESGKVHWYQMSARALEE